MEHFYVKKEFGWSKPPACILARDFVTKCPYTVTYESDKIIACVQKNSKVKVKVSTRYGRRYMYMSTHTYPRPHTHMDTRTHSSIKMKGEQRDK